MASNEFLHFFPTPMFLRMPTAGLDIADGEIRFIELREDRGTFKVEKYDRQELAPGVISGGSIQKKDELVAALTKIREANRLKFVRVSLPEEKSYLFHTTVPYVADHDEMRESISFTIEENVPLSADEVVFDYEVIANGSAQTSKEVAVAVSVLPISVVDLYVDVIRSSGLRPMSLMVESQAIAKAVVPKENSNAFLVLNVRAETTAIYIVNNNTVHFTSAFSTKGGSVSAPITSSAITQGGEIITEGEKDQENDPDDLASYSSSILTEVRRVYNYWHSRGVGSKEANKIKKFLVCGDSALSKQFQQKLAELFSTNVETANVWTNALTFDEYVPDIPAEEALRYAAAIGLALPQNI